jgi:hypothetical protein
MQSPEKYIVATRTRKNGKNGRNATFMADWLKCIDMEWSKRL